jgi:hypothetical protein
VYAVYVSSALRLQPGHGKLWLDLNDAASSGGAGFGIVEIDAIDDLMPVTTRGNWFAPVSRRHFFNAAWRSEKTISFTVFRESASLVRRVRCWTAAKSLSMGLAVRRRSQSL